MACDLSTYLCSFDHFGGDASHRHGALRQQRAGSDRQHKTKLAELERLAREIESVVRPSSAYAERLTGGYYLNIEPDRGALIRYGLGVGELQDVVATALGGETVTTMVQGRERFGISVRYPRELRDSPQMIETQVLVATPDGAMLPLGQLAHVELTRGAPSIRTENALLSAYIYVDTRESDIGGFVARAQQAVREQVKFPAGYYATWSGQFEYMQRAAAKLKIVVPLTLALIFLLLYLHFRKVTESLIVMLSVPFALVGGVWLLWLLGYNLSVAVAVGFIALAGVAAETGVVMLVYLDHAWQEKLAEYENLPHPNPLPEGEGANVSRLVSRKDLYDAVMHGAVERVRPKMMTVAAIMAGLLPILWSSGAGSEVMRRIAAPMVGGMLTSTVLTLLVIPVLYAWLKKAECKVAGERAKN